MATTYLLPKRAGLNRIMECIFTTGLFRLPRENNDVLMRIEIGDREIRGTHAPDAASEMPTGLDARRESLVRMLLEEDVPFVTRNPVTGSPDVILKWTIQDINLEE